MADLFRDRSCMHWWLPNDERYPPIIRSIRKLVEERTAPAKNMPAEDLRDMKAIFATMKLEDGQSSVTTGDGPHTRVAVATQEDTQQMNFGEPDTYATSFGERQGFWDEGHGENS